jgi:hypothetical protein
MSSSERVHIVSLSFYHILRLNFEWTPEYLLLPGPMKSNLTYIYIYIYIFLHYKIEPSEIMFLNYQLIKVSHPGI